MSSDHPSGPPSWSELLPELLSTIFNSLRSRSDMLAFRGVCRNWRESSVPLPPNIICPLLRRQIHIPENPYLIATATKVFLLTPHDPSNHQWMVMAEETIPGKLHLRHPITGKLFDNLPVKNLDVTRFRVSEVSTPHYNIRYSILPILKTVLRDDVTLVLHLDSYTGLFTLPPINANHVNITGILHWLFQFEGSLTGSPDWDDIVMSYNGRTVGVDIEGRLYAFEYEEAGGPQPLVVFRRSLLANRVIQPICERYVKRRKRLVVNPFTGKLHLVVRGDITGCAVFVLNEEEQKWDVVESLGEDVVLFVGVVHCFFARIHESMCPGNSVVFGDYSFPTIDDGEYPFMFRFNGLDDRRIWVCPLDEQRYSVISSLEDDGIWQCDLGEPPYSMVSRFPKLLQMLTLPPPSWFSSSTSYLREADA